MAERWQQWMPFHIDRFRGSPDVQAMHPAARIGYLYLLASAWQNEDCTLPSDPLDLASISGLGDELWAVYGPRIMRKFVSEGSRYANTVLREEWKLAREKFESNRDARSKAGQIGNAKRWGDRKRDDSDRKCDEDDRKGVASSSQNVATGTGTGTGTDTSNKKEQKTSRGKRESNPMHDPVKGLIFAYYRHQNEGRDPPWDGAEGKQLGMLLKAQPSLDVDYWRRCLGGRNRSDVNHAERPSVWLRNLPSYRNAVNAFKQPKENEDGTPRNYRNPTKSEITMAAAQNAARFDSETASDPSNSATGYAPGAGIFDLLSGIGRVPDSGSIGSNRPALPPGRADGQDFYAEPWIDGDSVPSGQQAPPRG